ncbi:phage tail sheath C-terminal domain-containing protein, partial [Clostridium sp.]|uniref:phage tail sheath C-terminal domain-containing protein n=1 Tax=Clostridium sp. TaxID=1506 RepID=UPI0035A0650F
AANTQSKAFNDECVVNIGNGGIYEGVTYTPAESACYVAGIIAAATMKESICNKETIFSDVYPKLSREQIEQCLKAGTLIFAGDGIATNAIVVDDVNTLKSYGEDQSESLGYIRAVRFMHIVNEDTTITKRDYIGKTPNGDLGQKVVLSALKQYFETLQSDGVIGDFTVEVDTDLQANAKDDEFYWKWSADYINVMKKIYGTGYIS